MWCLRCIDTCYLFAHRSTPFHFILRRCPPRRRRRGVAQTGQLGTGRPSSVGLNASDMGAALLPVELGSNRTARALSAGGTQTCAILDDDSVKCWGTFADSDEFYGASSGLPSRGRSPAQMGNYLPLVDLGEGPGRNATAITAGWTHTCVVLGNQKVKCWGGDYLTGRVVTLTNKIGYEAYLGNDEGEMGDALPYIDLGSDTLVTDVKAGWYHTCALATNGELRCWVRPELSPNTPIAS